MKIESHAGELISQCGDPFENTFKIYSYKLKSKIKIKILQTKSRIYRYQSSRSGMSGPCQITFTYGSFIASIRLLVLQDQNDSLRLRANSQFISKQFACTASASFLTSDREELIAKKENLLVQDYRSRLPVDNFPILSHSHTKVTDSADSD